MRYALFLFCLVAFSPCAFGQDPTQGTLQALGKNGKPIGSCPLKTTDVSADISGFVARVRVKQVFHNPFSRAIEAVYIFPLSERGAVDQMTMTIGSRTIRGKMMKRDEARQVYETAKVEGKTASLLDQERPNIFTQSVANIMPGESVEIEISYVETLKYEDGSYEFVFPMTVGPRYLRRSVTDGARIRPRVAASRAGHDISIDVNLNAGVPLEEIRSTSHAIDQLNLTPALAKISLRDQKVIPNKDFILRYDVTGKRIEDAVLAHRAGHGGFFTLVLQPPDKIAAEDRTPKEIVFVLDTSGSMSGFPIEKAKEAMKLSLDGLYPEDTFNLITFAGDTFVLFDSPVPATQANLEKARGFLESRSGGGGTEMMGAIKAALEPSDSQEHVRIVCFMTDGYVGNENEIIAEIQKHPQARVFSFGIGSSVNRFLLDKMAEAGRGEVEYVSLDDDGSKAARKFYERVRTPLLTDLAIDWNGLPVSDVYPARLSDLFSSKPVIVNGRFSGAGSRRIKLRGKVAGQPYEREITVNLPESESANDSLASLWARRRVDELSDEALSAEKADIANKTITDIGLEFGVMTQFTSLVAVEERVVNHNGTPVKMEVPVEIPEGVAHGQTTDGDLAKSNAAHGYIMQGFAGRRSKKAHEMVNMPANVNSLTLTPQRGLSSGAGTGSGMGSGSGSGAGNSKPPPPALSGAPISVTRLNQTQYFPAVSAGVVNGKARQLPKPAYPAAARAVSASGTVSVQVTIDESGSVISSTPVSGHPLLRAAAAQAAKKATFAPTMLSGKPVKVTGLITYNFNDPAKPSMITVTSGEVTVVEKEASPALSPEQLREQRRAEKFHAWVYALVARQDKKRVAGPHELQFVLDGKAEIKITLSRSSPDLLEKLRTAGFELTAERGTVLVGRIAIANLGALAEIEEIVLVSPVAKI